MQAGALGDLGQRVPFALEPQYLVVLGRTYKAKRFTHDQEVAAVVVSYYWHFVDVVWIGLFFVIYVLK